MLIFIIYFFLIQFPIQLACAHTIYLELSEIDCLHIDVSNAIMKRKNNDIFMEHQLPNAGYLDPIADLQTQVIPITTPKYLEPDTSL